MELLYSFKENTLWSVSEDNDQHLPNWHSIARFQPERVLNAFLDEYEQRYNRDRLTPAHIKTLWHWWYSGYQAAEKQFNNKTINQNE